MSHRSKIDAEVTRWARVISLIGLAGLLVLAAITVGEVLLRWLFDYPILGISDVSSLVVTLAVASCFPLVFAERRSITVKIVGKLSGPRVNALLEAFGSLVSLAIFILVAWQLWVYANELATNNQTTWVVLWPMSPWYRIAALLMVLCVPVLTVVFFSQVKAALFPERDSDNKDSQPPVEAEESG
jgi:TRAP-type C4-dicarboxylate transport system permease small subunit